MKYLRVAAVGLVFLFMLMQAGCGTWSIDFTQAVDADLADWGGMSSWSLNDNPGDGLTISDDYVMTPVGFPADFTLTVNMFMDINWSDTADFRIWIGGDESDSPEHYIECVFTLAGDDSSEEVLIHEDGVGLDYRDIDTLSPIPGIKNGDNVFKLVKKGDHIRITMNGTEIIEFDIMYYNPAASYIFLSTSEDSSQEVYYRKMKVSYEGDPVPLP